jgi:hypothetical protein
MQKSKYLAGLFAAKRRGKTLKRQNVLKGASASVVCCSSMERKASKRQNALKGAAFLRFSHTT